MAHQTGSCTSTEDAINKLIDFVNNYTNWTASTSGISPSGYDHDWTFTKGTRKVYLAYDTAGNGTIRGMCSPTTQASWPTYDYNSASNTTGLYGSEVNSCKGATTYHFFESRGEEIYVALKIGSRWTHFCFGNMLKRGSWTGGLYFAPVYSDPDYATSAADINNNFLFGPAKNLNDSGMNNRCMPHYDIEQDTRIIAIGKAGAYTTVNQGKYSAVRPMYGMSFDMINNADGALLRTGNAYNKRTIGLPLDFFILDESDSKWRHIGSITGIRFVNVEYLDAGETINTDWMVFPLTSKSAGDGTFCTSDNFGVAYRIGNLST